MSDKVCDVHEDVYKWSRMGNDNTACAGEWSCKMVSS